MKAPLQRQISGKRLFCQSLPLHDVVKNDQQRNQIHHTDIHPHDLGNAGLGKETILQISKHNPAHVYMGARTASKAAEAIESIKKIVPEARITHITLDLTSFDSIKSAVAAFREQSSRLDCLINNAGVMATPPEEQTKDGYELQFGTNHMGHALLTKLLLPTLRTTSEQNGGDARIVNVSSAGHHMALSGINTDKVKMKDGNKWGRYGNSKLANILHAKGIAQHETTITAVSLHPGLIYTQLYDASTAGSIFTRVGMAIGSRLFFSGVEEGAFNQIWAATAPIAQLQSGAYYTSPGGSRPMMSGSAKDKRQTDRLWDFTEKELESNGF